MALLKLHSPNAVFIAILVVVPIFMFQAACCLLIRQNERDTNILRRLHMLQKCSKDAVDRGQKGKQA